MGSHLAFEFLVVLHEVVGLPIFLHAKLDGAEQ